MLNRPIGRISRPLLMVWTDSAKIIPYCLFVSFEVAEGFDVDLYTDVAAKIHQRVEIQDS